MNGDIGMELGEWIETPHVSQTEHIKVKDENNGVLYSGDIMSLKKDDGLMGMNILDDVFFTDGEGYECTVHQERLEMLSDEELTAIRRLFSDVRQWLFDFDCFEKAFFAKLGPDGMARLLWTYKTVLQPGICDMKENETLYRARLFQKRLSEEEETNRLYKSKDDLAPFYGYGKEESGAPPASIHKKGGRFNDANTVFLYCSSSKEIALLETFGGSTGLISVAALRVLKGMKFLYLPTSVSACCPKNDKNKVWLKDFFFDVAQVFCLSSNSSEGKENIYRACQCVASSAKALGYDGIAYSSSKTQQEEDKTRMNYVFFNPGDCEMLSSELFRIDSVSCETTPSLENGSKKRG